MTYDKPITIQRQDSDTEEWEDYLKLHAAVNKATGGTTYTAGADQFQVVLNFDVRYSQRLEKVRFSTQPFRICYRGQFFKVTDYDDYMERHQSIRLVGELYG